MYYNYNDLFSYNAMFNFVIGERGVGKTYGILKKCVKDFINTMNNEHPRQFVYLRRYKSELKEFKTILDPHIYNNEFGEHEVAIKGNKVYVDKRIAGYAYPISNSVTIKSSTFPNVDKIVFDEFIIDKGNVTYMQEEVTKFLEVYETIARMRDVHVYFIGNAITIYNPYFEYFNLSIPYDGPFKTFNNGLILVNYIKNEEYREAKSKTLFGQIIASTDYGKYAIDNEFLRDNDDTFIEKKTGNCTIESIFIIKGQFIGLWKSGSLWYFSNDYDPNCKNVFAFDASDHNTITRLMHTGGYLSSIYARYRAGHLRFETGKIKHLVTQYLK